MHCRTDSSLNRLALNIGYLQHSASIFPAAYALHKSSSRCDDKTDKSGQEEFLIFRKCRLQQQLRRSREDVRDAETAGFFPPRENEGVLTSSWGKV